jgi:hypothetical protein
MKSLLRAAFFVLASLLATHAYAAACATGSVASFANSTCTIGDLLFGFGTPSIRDDSHEADVSLSTLTLTPNVGIGTEGFTITGVFTETDGEGELDWAGVSFASLSFQREVIGVTATTISTVQGAGTLIPFAEFNETDLFNGSNGAFAQPGIGNCGGFASCSADFRLGDVTTATGNLAALGGIAGGGGSVSSDATEFIVREVPPVAPVPEPSEWGLIISGLVLVAGITKRKSGRGVDQSRAPQSYA